MHEKDHFLDLGVSLSATIYGRVLLAPIYSTIQVTIYRKDKYKIQTIKYLFYSIMVIFSPLHLYPPFVSDFMDSNTMEAWATMGPGMHVSKTPLPTFFSTFPFVDLIAWSSMEPGLQHQWSKIRSNIFLNFHLSMLSLAYNHQWSQVCMWAKQLCWLFSPFSFVDSIFRMVSNGVAGRQTGK